MWFQVFINERRKPKKGVGTMEFNVGTIQGENVTKKVNRKTDKEFM